MKPFLPPLAAAWLVLFTLPASAEIIGVDQFDYPNGAIAGQGGGTFWDYKNVAPAGHTGVKSTWDDIFSGGSTSVSGGRLVTNNNGWAKREYNGAIESDGAVNEGNVAKAVYARVTVTTGATLPNYFGLASYDFAGERMFVGKCIDSSTFGYEIMGGANGNGSVTVPANATFTLVFRLDFANDTISLYLDPDLNLPVTAPANTAAGVLVSTATYTGSNWSTALRLASGSGGDPVAWDDLVVATTWDDLGTVVTTISDEDNGNLNGTISLREAVKYSPPGTLVTFDPNMSGTTITLGSQLTLPVVGNLMIDATALTHGVTVDGNNAARHFRVDAGKSLTLRGLTLTGGSNLTVGGEGGSIYSIGTLLLDRCTFTGNAANQNGGAVYTSGNAVITHCTVSGNSISSTGGAIYNSNALSVQHCTIMGNSAGTLGGGITNFGTLLIRDTIVAGNAAPSSPDIYSGSASLVGVNLIGDLAGSGLSAGPNMIVGDPKLSPLGWFGGPVQTMHPLIGSPAIDAAGTLNPGGTDARGFPRFVDGDAASAGAQLDIGAVEAGPLTAVAFDSDTSNTGTLRQRIGVAAASPGGRIGFFAGLNFPGTITLNGTQLDIPAGSSIFIDASNLSGPVTISGNNASRVFSIPSGATVAMHSLKIRTGRVDEFNIGGGILNDGTCTVIACTFSGNYAGLGGGGIANPGTCAVIASTFEGNTVFFGGGGGIANFNICTVTNSTFTGNMALIGGGAGIISSQTCRVISSTLSGNSSHDGTGGGISTSGTFQLVSSIVAGNTGGEVYGVITDTNSIISGTPLLAPLGDYGGPTQTMALLPGSPARNAGAAGARLTDQRGFPLVGLPDIGAYEAGTHANYNAFIWETLPNTATAPQHAATFDYDGDGATNGDEYIVGTIVTSPLSVFRITQSALSSPNFSVTFPTVINRTYQLQSSPDLANPWTNVGSATAGTGGNVTLPANVTGFTRYFFRVSVSGP